MKAVLKESLRLNPVSVGIGRVLAQDAMLSGYRVPRGVSTIEWSSLGYHILKGVSVIAYSRFRHWNCDVCRYAHTSRMAKWFFVKFGFKVLPLEAN